MPRVFPVRRLQPHTLQRWVDTFESVHFLPKTHRYAISVTLLLIASILFWPLVSPQELSDRQAEETPLPENAYLVSPSVLTFDSTANWQTFHLRSDQSLSQLLSQMKLSADEIIQITQQAERPAAHSQFHHGEIVKLRRDQRGLVTAVVIDNGLQQILYIRQNDHSFLPAE
ncbi:MAG: hypothetical protein XXXJIFNMEKO3_02572 [Candidatus Erwinia impunctatus]|nr:hypothetical protein XXXJIFNMEKO_02572 [Culicoides impunctatus]